MLGHTICMLTLKREHIWWSWWAHIIITANPITCHNCICIQANTSLYIPMCFMRRDLKLRVQLRALVFRTSRASKKSTQRGEYCVNCLRTQTAHVWKIQENSFFFCLQCENIKATWCARATHLQKRERCEGNCLFAKANNKLASQSSLVGARARGKSCLGCLGKSIYSWVNDTQNWVAAPKM